MPLLCFMAVQQSQEEVISEEWQVRPMLISCSKLRDESRLQAAMYARLWVVAVCCPVWCIVCNVE